jgi:peptidoglycan/LPS O-acetylase OafA/YrhL
MGYLRFYLALLVCYAHLEHDLWLKGIKYLCPIPVEIFYIISGFIMPLAFKKYYFNKNNYVKSSIKFILARFIKIFPLYWFAIFIAFLDQNFIHYLHNQNQELNNFRVIIKNIILVLNDHGKSYLPVSWSLDHELRFYLIIPILFYFLKKKIMLAAAGVIIFLISNQFNASTDSIINSAKFFYIGIILFVYKDKLSKLIDNCKINLVLYAIYLHFFFIIISLIFSLNIYLSAISSIIISIVLIMNKNYEKNSKIDSLLGNISYPVYILHPLILGFTYNGFKKIYYFFFSENLILFYNLYQAFFAFITITIISLIAYKFFLKPIENFKKKLKN